MKLLNVFYRKQVVIILKTWAQLLNELTTDLLNWILSLADWNSFDTCIVERLVERVTKLRSRSVFLDLCVARDFYARKITYYIFIWCVAKEKFRSTGVWWNISEKYSAYNDETNFSHSHGSPLRWRLQKVSAQNKNKFKRLNIKNQESV